MTLSVASDIPCTSSSPGSRQSIISIRSTSTQSLPRSARRLLSNIRFSTILTSTSSTPALPSPSSTPSPQLISAPSKPSKPSKPRPKHIPIIIPYHAHPFLPSSPISLASASTSSVVDFPVIPSAVTQRLSKQGVRYVEIKIPDHVAFKYLPPTPRSSQFSTDPKESDSLNSSKDKDSIRDSISTASGIISLEGILQQEKEEKERKDSGVYASMAYPLALNTRAQPNVTPGILPSPSQTQPTNLMGPSSLTSGMANTQPQLYRLNTQDMTPDRNPQVRTPASSFQNPSAGPSPAATQGPGVTQNPNSNIGLSGFVCNVHRTTGREPKPLVGATTTIVGDNLYIFGGRRISRAKTQLTSDLYELDLIHRNWTKLECKGDIPPPRYFHSVCALGDTKLVCYGGMSQSSLPNGNASANQPSQDAQSAQNSMDVMSDVHIYDIPSKTWMKINSVNSPQGRYAHCATILPSSAVFSSPKATLSAIQHNLPSTETPNQGKLGVSLDGSGGAEMIIVGGQDSTNHYIEQISVFNLRSLTWTSTSPLGRQCGAYRSVTAPLSASIASQIGVGGNPNQDSERPDKPPDGCSAMLIYSNYNFLDVKLELQIHLPDGTLVEKPMQGGNSPPGLRFPNGGVIDNHFVVSGTFLTSYKQEYALWALDLRSLVWNRIDIGSSTFSQGSWNRGVLWQRRNAFVILGNRKRSLVEDYNHRRVNFSNMCVVELEAFGLYDNPRRMSPMSGYVSASSSLLSSLSSAVSTDPAASISSKSYNSDRFGSGRELSRAAEELGRMVLGSPELADMDFLAINGERIPVNSKLVARRWGSCFIAVMREAVAGAEGNDTATLRPSAASSAQSSRNSSITITPSLKSTGNESLATTATYSAGFNNPENAINPANRPRTLYLPHTPLTIHALLHFLYTSSLPPPSSHLCTPQILCSLLQIARPYKIDGLLEAVVERLHAVLDNRNTAAIFNAAAMAAGGGDGVEFVEDAERTSLRTTQKGTAQNVRVGSPLLGEDGSSKPEGSSEISRKPTNVGAGGKPTTPNLNDVSKDVEQTSPTNSGAEASEDDGEKRRDEDHQTQELWSGSLSAVVGLQKRGLRGLMEGRRIREMGSRDTAGTGGSGGSGGDRVGLGIENR